MRSPLRRRNWPPPSRSYLLPGPSPFAVACSAISLEQRLRAGLSWSRQENSDVRAAPDREAMSALREGDEAFPRRDGAARRAIRLPPPARGIRCTTPPPKNGRTVRCARRLSSLRRIRPWRRCRLSIRLPFRVPSSLRWAPGAVRSEVRPWPSKGMPPGRCLIFRFRSGFFADLRPTCAYASRED